MNFVEPIRDRKQIAHIKNLLKGQGRFRDLLLFVVGINTALRISDVLQPKIGNFVDEQQHIRRRFWVREQKRGKRHEVAINDSIEEALALYLTAYPDIVSDPMHYVFFNSQTNDYREPLKRVRAWKVIASLCKQVGLRGNFGTHSLRKTWGYHARMNGVDLALIMHKLNHESSPIPSGIWGSPMTSLKQLRDGSICDKRCVSICYLLSPPCSCVSIVNTGAHSRGCAPICVELGATGFAVPPLPRSNRQRRRAG